MSAELSFPKEKINIVLLEGVHESAVQHFEHSGYSNITHVSHALSDRALNDAIANAHMLGIRSRTQITDAVLEHAPKLMSIGCFCIGTNQVDLAAASCRGIPVFNAPHSNTRSVAELMIAEMVMMLRGIGDKSAAAHQGKWQKSAKGSHELRGKTVGIIGYGHIGSQVSILAEAFGMTVLYYDVEAKLPMGNARQLASLDELLPMADIVTLHVPAAADTVNLINSERLSQMKKGGYLLNASRGNVVDIDALAAALKNQHLAGVAVDVFPSEPSSNEEEFKSPLRGLANVVLTPHIGGSTLEAQRNIGIEVASKLVHYSDQGSTIGSVNVPAISLAPQKQAHRLLHIHHNQPGVLRSINKILAESNANILGQHLQTTSELGYVVIDIDQTHPLDLRDTLSAVPGTIRCRILY